MVQIFMEAHGRITRGLHRTMVTKKTIYKALDGMPCVVRLLC